MKILALAVKKLRCGGVRGKISEKLTISFMDAPKGCWLVDQDSGCQVGPSLFYPNYERHLPELDVLNEDTSPYAQTGFSIWDIKCVQNRILIVHDIERCAPVIFDAIQF